MADEERTYSSEITGLPPLKMVLVHPEVAQKDGTANGGPRLETTKEEQDKEEAVLRLIAYLNKKP